MPQELEKMKRDERSPVKMFSVPKPTADALSDSLLLMQTLVALVYIDLPSFECR